MFRPGDLCLCGDQGSEYPAVVIPVMTQHYTMLQRNLLYTGVTRGKR
jgi:exodeoxyribonuclease V alpha subunit